jgi:hypothetical protein
MMKGFERLWQNNGFHMIQIIWYLALEAQTSIHAEMKPLSSGLN